ncbi:MAG: hypothetical protein Q7R40_16900 [Phaeospirillum sp.]|nr:hypothetical protein [Phaeospirillum sp.]
MIAARNAATPGPWTRPEIDLHHGRILSNFAPACPAKVYEVVEQHVSHKCLAIARTDALADAIVALHTHLPALTDGSISPVNWELSRRAVRAAIGPANGHNDKLVLELARVTTGPDANGAHEIGCPAEVEGHPLKRRTILTAQHADGSDAEADANLIAALLAKSVGLLTGSMAKVIATRGIGLTTVVIDASFAKEFDAQNWEDRDGDIYLRKSTERLADQLAGTDGMWIAAHPQTGDGFLIPEGALDFRRHRLLTSNRAKPTVVNIPPEIQARLKAAAAEFGDDLGRAIAARFQ